MRITSFTIFNQLTRSLNSNIRDMSRLSNSLATGKKINSPSDDTSGMMKAMDYKVSINEIEQYRKNINEAESRLGFTDSTLSSVSNALIRARELALQASNGTETAGSRAAIAAEVDDLRDEILKMSNTKFRNRFLFSGFKTDTTAFDPAAGYAYQGDSGEINLKIDKGVTMAINIPGDTVFGSGPSSVMAVLDDLYNNLTNNSLTGIQTALTEIDTALDQVNSVRADIGGRLNHLEGLRSNLDDRDLTWKTYLSDTEDTDIAETVSEISKIEVALQSLRQSGAEILSQSLLNFLR